MAIHFSSMEIDQFRGIKQLKIPSLNHFNIIVGDNNCGKTSVLEAILLFRNPNEFSNLLETASLRRQLLERTRESLFTSFLFLFPHNNSNHLKISISAVYKEQEIKYILDGSISRYLVDINEINKHEYSKSINYSNLPSEDIGFKGIQTCTKMENIKSQKQILYKRLDNVENISLQDNKDINIVYISPFSHFRGGAFAEIIRNKEFKNLCVDVLKLFDPDIQDLILTQEEFEVFPTETIVHSKHGNMPLSIFGDGIKKVITIASKIVEAVNGILLVDEIETSIHEKYYDKIFSFVILACKQFNVQLFITTHNMEAIDALLNIQHYDTNEKDDVSVITLKKDIETSQTLSRVLAGKRVFTNRENFGFEVRL